jgi:hypothetical protein
MKTRKLKKIKTRKMKGGYIVYENGSWIVPPLKANGKPISPVVRAYSTSEASFFNALRVPRVDTKEWLKIPNHADGYLEVIAGNILDDDVPEDEFMQQLTLMKAAQSYLIEAHRRRSENDIIINNMTPAEKQHWDITDAAIESHTARTKDISVMLKEIKKFMEPYISKERDILEKHQKTVKPVPKPKPFDFSKILNEDSSESDPEEIDERRAEDVKPKRKTRKSKPQSTDLDSLVKEFTSLDVHESIVSPIYTVSNFQYEFIHPTSLCFSVTPAKMFVFSENNMTLISEDGTIINHPIDELDLSFCDINDNYILLSGNTLYVIQVNGNEIQIYKAFAEPTKIDEVSKSYKGVTIIDKSRNEFYGVCAQIPQVEYVATNPLSYTRIALPPLNKPMGISYSPISLNMAIAVSGNNTIVIVTPNERGIAVTKTIGGKRGFIDGNKPSFNNPTNVLILPDGSIIVSDTGNHAIRRIYKKNEEWITETIAGNGSKGFLNGIGKEATFNEPRGMALFQNLLYVADKNNNAIRIIDLSALFQ